MCPWWIAHLFAHASRPRGNARWRPYWKDTSGNIYELGDLYQKGDKYCFDIAPIDTLKKATKAGCFGIGELNLFYQNHESDTLFDFFKRRIPPENHIQIEEILKEFNLEEYNEMELLKLTKGRLNTDRYYLEEV